MAKLLIENGANVNAQDKKDLKSPLHYAAIHAGMSRCKDIVEELLVKLDDINVDAKDKKEMTPLHYAAHYGDKDTVELLIEHGANVNAKDKEGMTTLHWACCSGSNVREDAQEVVEVMIKRGANVNAKDKKEKTPLNYAAENIDNFPANLLIENGADVNAKDKEGKTPLNYATENGPKNTEDLLRENAPSANILCCQRGIEEYSKASNIGR